MQPSVSGLAGLCGEMSSARSTAQGRTPGHMGSSNSTTPMGDVSIARRTAPPAALHHSNSSGFASTAGTGALVRTSDRVGSSSSTAPLGDTLKARSRTLPVASHHSRSGGAASPAGEGQQARPSDPTGSSGSRALMGGASMAHSTAPPSHHSSSSGAASTAGTGERTGSSISMAPIGETSMRASVDSNDASLVGVAHTDAAHEPSEQVSWADSWAEHEGLRRAISASLLEAQAVEAETIVIDSSPIAAETPEDRDLQAAIEASLADQESQNRSTGTEDTYLQDAIAASLASMNDPSDRDLQHAIMRSFAFQGIA
mmetsp:Transcript_52825/g.171905  ORF Transcript_52825/g.171905 Transcript_52825/m.171905 type:complete len:314 (-) Transcript_52825:199-1140(-)